MKTKYPCKMFVLLVLIGSMIAQVSYAKSTKKVIITDVEPDDRIALLLASQAFPNDIALVGTTVLNSSRKAALATKILNQLNLSHVRVAVGSGGLPNQYPELNACRAAKEYEGEGLGILTSEQLASYRDQSEFPGTEFQKALKDLLTHEADENVELIVLAAPTDLKVVFEENSELKRKVKTIHLMGGWASNAEGEARTTYNWNMDVHASEWLLRQTDLAITVYSSHVVKPSFGGGSVNRNIFPDVIALIEKLTPDSAFFHDFRYANVAWNNHVMNTLKVLQPVIGPFVDHQFTPADPLVITAMYNSEVIEEYENVNIQIDPNDLTPSGYKVNVKSDPSSKTRLAAKFNKTAFENTFIELLNKYGGLDLGLKMEAK